MQEAENVVGICGLYCGTCPMYLAGRENDVEELRKIPDSSGIPLAEVQCDRCLSERLFEPCIACRPGFRRCAAEKKVTWCFECPEFPCQRLELFRDVHVVNGISHHEQVIDALRSMKEHSIERFVKEQERKGRCPQCGK